MIAQLGHDGWPDRDGTAAALEMLNPHEELARVLEGFPISADDERASDSSTLT
jgi:hypothetical protein